MGETPEDGACDETMADTRPAFERAPAAVLVAGRYEVKKLLGEGGWASPALPVLFGVSDVLEVRGDVAPIFVIHGADHHPPGAFPFMLVAVNVASVLAAGRYAAQYRDLLDGLDADNRAKVHALSRLMS